jgi:hypothetical protein
MLTFSSDPQVAENQMHAVIFIMTTFGYIDGDFDQKEKKFVSDRIKALVASRVEGAKLYDDQVKAELIGKFTSHFHEVFEQIDARVRDLLTEPVAAGEDPHAFIQTKLKQQCFEIMQTFDASGQEAMMSAIDELLMADGEAHPAEVKFRGELSSLLEADLGVEMVEEGEKDQSVKIEGEMKQAAAGAVHPFFTPFEQHYNPDQIEEQVEGDRTLIRTAMKVIEDQRKKGHGRLQDKWTIDQLKGEDPFLDGHIYVHMPKESRRYELLVLGDLHGCYSVLKASIMQSRFFDKVNAYRKAPSSEPYPILVLLGDYIDRGLFSLNGVLRTVLQLLVTAPEHVYVLRGNHEYYFEHQGTIYGGVQPSEAINTLRPHVPVDALRDYMALFEAMPNVLIFDKIFFVHGGLPRDRELKAKWKNLSTLNDADLRFQMMWSDPSTAEIIPADLQDKCSRFAFGSLQFRAFMRRIGTTTMIRGHEKVNEGFHKNYDGDVGTLITLFSAGGKDNEDLPADSSYRTVTPKALTITHERGVSTLRPWAPDYRAYNDPSRNAFFQVPPVIELRTK